MSELIKFIDLAAQRRLIADRIDARIRRVLENDRYIMGPEVAELERSLAAFCGAKHCISCANGTDALVITLMAIGLKPKQAVLCPSFTFAATAEAIACLGATPIFVDVLEDTFNLDPVSLRTALARVNLLGIRAVGIISVDLFGRPADYDAIERVCRDEDLWLICDAAQSFGAQYRGRNVGSIGYATTTSFFPSKPLGCYGDGGAIFTNDDNVAETLRSIRIHGQGSNKYENVRIGMNSRLDTLQAAILIEKLMIFPSEIDARNEVARHYNHGLANVVKTPPWTTDIRQVWAQYTIRVPARQRACIAARLGSQGIPTAIYYPQPLHRQTAYRHFPCGADALPVSEQLSQEVLSLPMHPYLSLADQNRVIDVLCSAASNGIRDVIAV